MDNSSIRAARAAARRSLIIVLVCAVAAWLLFVAGLYVDLATAATATSVDYSSTEATDTISFTRYFMFAAVAVFGLGALTGLRRTARLRASGATTSLARPVQRFSSASLIVAAAISTLTCAMLFFDGFLGGSPSPAPLLQLANLYVPIVLHTALVVTLILAGFVFAPRPAESVQAPAATQQDGPAIDSLATNAVPDQLAQRNAALGFAVPVITSAAALIAGLIAADLTGSATQVWLWTLVLAVIGVGIVAGTRTAQRALGADHAGQRPRGSAVGAKNLNFVLSIVLVGSAVILSLGYGASAVSSLRSNPWMSVNLFDERSNDASAEGLITWSASGSDLKPGSEITVVLQPGNEALGKGTISREGWGDATGTLPADGEPGEYVLEARATSDDGRAIEATVPFVRLDTGELSEGGSADTYKDFPMHVSAVSARWVFSDLLPAGILLLIATAVVYLTLTGRSREPLTNPANTTSATSA